LKVSIVRQDLTSDGSEFQVCGHYRSIFNHCDIIGQQSHRIRWNNTK